MPIVWSKKLMQLMQIDTIDASNKLNKNLSVNSRFKLHIPILNLKLK